MKTVDLKGVAAGQDVDVVLKDGRRISGKAVLNTDSFIDVVWTDRGVNFQACVMYNLISRVEAPEV